jgi:hypothetical protein
MRPPEPLGPQHQLEGFDCGNATLNRWLQQRALANERRSVDGRVERSRLSRVLSAGHPERTHGMDAAAAQLMGLFQGLLACWVGQQVGGCLAGRAVMALMQRRR